MKVYNPSGYSYVTVVELDKTEVDKIDFALCNQPTETLENYYKRQTVKPDVLINGGFFAMGPGTTVFNYKDEGQVISSDSKYRWGMGVTQTGELQYGSTDEHPEWKDFICGYPNLIDNGQKVKIDFAKELNYRARRSMLGYNDTKIFIVGVDSPGLAYSAMQNLMLDLGCKYAINLDGGGSTRMLIDGTVRCRASTNRPIDNVVAVYLKKNTQTNPSQPKTPEKKTIYRIQLGAFSIKENAERFKEQIQDIPDAINAGYKNAYVVKIGNLWKIQVGAYSIKTNAEKVVKDLQNKGFNAFITVN